MASIAQLVESKAATTQIQTFVPRSSFLALLEYDQNNLTLTSHLLNGSIYQAKFFLPTDWEALKTSQNHGKHWANNVKGKKLSVRIKSAKAPKSEIKRRNHANRKG
jgi:hypothetical protein